MLQPGLEATIEETVTDAMTAESIGSGDVPVLGTPAVLALAERAACAAIAEGLDAGDTSVGSSVELEHLAPTPVGGRVTARSKLIAADGRKLSFEFTVFDDAGEVARGRHHRFVVNREKFVRSASDR
jgi:predicted thioesterase